MTRNDIAVLIAGAGQSKRMGFHKVKLNICGQPLMYWMARKVQKLNPKRAFITLPDDIAADPMVAFQLDLYGARPRRNIYPHLGFAGSIKTIVEEWGDYALGLLVCPIDSPIFSENLLHLMFNMFQNAKNSPQIVVPFCNFFPGHPVLISRHFFSALKVCHQSGGLRSVIDNNKRSVRGLIWPDKRILLNINSLSSLSSKIMNDFE